MSETKFDEYKILIAKRILMTQFSSEALAENQQLSDQELLEEFDAQYQDYEVSVRSLTWRNGSWATISNIFDYYMYLDEVEIFGPYETMEEAESHITLELMEDEREPISHRQRYTEHEFTSPVVQATLRSSKAVQAIIREDLNESKIFDENGNFSDDVEMAILDLWGNSSEIIDSYGPLSDGYSHINLINWEQLYWLEFPEGGGTSGYFLNEIEARFYAEENVLPPYDAH